MENLPDGVSVAMDAAIGRTIRGSNIKRVYVDFSLLSSTLNQLGEGSSEPNIPLEINIRPLPDYEGSSVVLGAALLNLDEGGKPKKRQVNVSLFELKEVNEKMAYYSCNSQSVNSTLLHELQHAVDYTRGDVYLRQTEHLQKTERQYYRKVLYRRLGAFGVLGAGGGLTVDGIMSNNTYMVSAGVVVSLSSLLINGNSYTPNDKKWLNQKAYLESPFEKRARGLEHFAKENNLTPAIIKFQETE